GSDVSALPSEDSTSERTAAPTTDGTQGASEETMDGEVALYENELTGSVRNEGGGPIPGASVTLSRRPLQAIAFVNDPIDVSGDVQTVTSSEGTFRFVRIEAYENYTLIVDHADYSRKEVGNVRVGVTGTFEEPPITLTQGSKLSGLISDSGGNPVPDAVVHLDGMLAGLGNKPSPDRMSTKSDSFGRYELTNCPKGQRTLLVSAEGYGSVLIAGIKISGKNDVERNVSLEVAEMICGRVIDSSNTPIRDAEVIALSYSTGNTQCRDFIKTDADGQFCLERLNPGQYTIAVSAKGFRPERAQRVATGSTGLVLELSPQASVSGRVVSKLTGEPLVTFTCVLRTAYDNTEVTSPTDIRQDFRSPLGEYTLTDIAPGTYVVEATAQGFASSFSQRFTVSQGQSLSGVTIEAGKGGSIKARIVDADGNPVKGALVSTHDNTWTDDAFTRALGDLFPTNATAKKVRSNKNGRFKIDGLSPENYQLRIQASGHSRFIKTDVLVGEGRDTDLGTIRLVAGGAVSGLVVDQAGQPIVGARVTLRVDGRPVSVFEPRETKSSAGGKYTFSNVPAGNYKIMAMRADPGDDVFGGLVDQQRSEQRVSVREGQEAKIDMRIGG
ncbi:MAG: carboxypeptidase-like regulatory domain-containing protein, partial [Planctomycetes bacterium]|nr:carboxypeptidase-like regulatory domain-containing protein [Planctomycetota bacterium]